MWLNRHVDSDITYMSNITETRLGECGFLIYFTRGNGRRESAFVSHACWGTSMGWGTATSGTVCLTPEGERHGSSCFAAHVGDRWVMAMNLCEIVAHIESLP